MKYYIEKPPSWWRKVGIPCAVCQKEYKKTRGIGFIGFSSKEEKEKGTHCSILGYACSRKCYNMYIFQNL